MSKRSCTTQINRKLQGNATRNIKCNLKITFHLNLTPVHLVKVKLLLTQKFVQGKIRRGFARCRIAKGIWCVATSHTRGGIAHPSNTKTYLPGYFLNHCTKYSIAVGTLAARTCVCFRGIDRLRRADQSVKWKHQVFCLRFLFLTKPKLQWGKKGTKALYRCQGLVRLIWLSLRQKGCYTIVCSSLLIRISLY